jgi:integrase
MEQRSRIGHGVDLKTVSERLGHSSIAITADIYTVVTEQMQHEAPERLGELFGTGKKLRFRCFCITLAH